MHCCCAAAHTACCACTIDELYVHLLLWYEINTTASGTLIVVNIIEPSNNCAPIENTLCTHAREIIMRINQAQGRALVLRGASGRGLRLVVVVLLLLRRLMSGALTFCAITKKHSRTSAEISLKFLFVFLDLCTQKFFRRQHASRSIIGGMQRRAVKVNIQGGMFLFS